MANEEVFEYLRYVNSDVSNDVNVVAYKVPWECDSKGGSKLKAGDTNGGVLYLVYGTLMGGVVSCVRGINGGVVSCVWALMAGLYLVYGALMGVCILCKGH